MSIAFCIGPVKETYPPFTESDLKIDPEDYKQKLITRWKGITFYESPATDEPLLWSLPADKPGAAGALASLLDNMQSICSGYDPHLAEFAIWHRSVIPGKYQLYMRVIRTEEALELTAETTIEDIYSFFASYL